MSCGIDCPCPKYEAIRAKLRDLSNSGKVYIIATPEDKKKLGLPSE